MTENVPKFQKKKLENFLRPSKARSIENCAEKSLSCKKMREKIQKPIKKLQDKFLKSKKGIKTPGATKIQGKILKPNKMLYKNPET